MSTFSLQGSLRITSGAIQATVPAKLMQVDCSPQVRLVPKSLILSISALRLINTLKEEEKFKKKISMNKGKGSHSRSFQRENCECLEKAVLYSQYNWQWHLQCNYSPSHLKKQVCLEKDHNDDKTPQNTAMWKKATYKKTEWWPILMKKGHHCHEN